MSEETKVEKSIRSSIRIPPHKLAGNGMVVITSRGTTRWQRFVNVVLFPWRYIIHGVARL